MPKADKMRELGHLVGDLYRISVAARECGLTFDELTLLLGIQYRLTEEREALDEGRPRREPERG